MQSESPIPLPSDLPLKQWRTRGFPKSSCVSQPVPARDDFGQRPVRRPDIPVARQSVTTTLAPSTTAPQSARPTPLPRRPKGRLFLGTVLAVLSLSAVMVVWNATIRYAAYGTITGRVIRVPASQTGNIKFLHVREGMDVAQGQLLVTIEDVELHRQLAQLRDELLIAQAELDAEMSRLQWQAQLRTDDSARAVAEYYELYGEMAEEQHRLDELKRRLERAETLHQRGAAPDEQRDAARCAVAGKEAKIEQLARAVAQRHKALEHAAPEQSQPQLKPLLVKIETLTREIDRVRELIARGEVRSPVHGRVVRSQYFAGEQIQTGSVLCEVLEAGSLQAMVFLPQSEADQLSLGDKVSLHVTAEMVPIQGTVSRVGEQYVPVPESLRRHYHAHALALPIYLQLERRGLTDQQLRLGTEVRLPRDYLKWPGAAVEPPTAPRNAEPPRTRVTALTGFRVANTIPLEEEP